MRRLAAMLPALALPALAAAGTFPTRFGESGLLDVPDAETLTLGRGAVYGEFRYDAVGGADDASGPFPLALGIGLGRNLEVGLALREWGRPGDPTPSPPLFTAALKLRFLDARGAIPAVAADVYLDRLNWKATTGFRLIGSTAEIGRLRFAGFAGAEVRGPTPPAFGATAGAAASILVRPELETVLEATWQPGGALLAGALRWSLAPDVGASLGLGWLPSQDGWRVSLGFALGSPVPRRRPAAPPPEAPPAAPAPVKPAAPAFADDRPHFRLRIPVRGIPGSESEPRHVQHPPSALSRGPGAAAPRARPPSPEEIRAAQVASLQDQLLARERRLRGAELDLAAREQRVASEMARLQTAEQALLSRERQLEGREKRLPPRPGPGQVERDAQARERQARAAETGAGRAERDLRVRAEAAQAREAVARAREDQLRAPLARIQAELSQERSRPRQTELVARANAARERQLGAAEERLAITRDRLDLLDQANDAHASRLSSTGQRLGSFEDRLAAAQKAAEEAAVAGAAARRKPAKGEKPSLVMVVKPPTSIVKAPGTAGAVPSAPKATLHAGVAVEKAVAAATVVYFAAPGQPMRELDREAVENIARLAARENCELLIWARAQNPGLMSEATRRAEDLKLFAVKAGPLSEAQVVTRITTRPSATGVDVVVSALREQPVAPTAPEGAAPPPAAAAALAEGETGKRQIRDAILRYRPEIEACVEAEMARRGLQGAEATLRLRVDRQGKVTRLDAGESVLASPPLEQCLRAASAGWRFPVADAEYSVDVPITVVGAGAKP
ncbi:MAG TPA: AgmX/PglI C-terminal domain-containing protein [Anaeromyxobacteraceae bacterium]|nr:AgmX/PglI C-terminal domain-containing protein [Anaeromyxobacteraceae bacterium]